MTIASDSIDDIFDSCLEAVESGRETIDQVVARYPEQADELRPLLETAVWFAGHKAVVAPRPGFVMASKGRLLADIKQSQNRIPGRASAPKRVARPGSALSGQAWRLGLQLGLVVVLIACLVLGSTGVAFAAQSALPGDRLYPVKTSLEQVQLLLTLDEAKQIQLHLELSQLRLVEIQELMDRGRYSDISLASENYRSHIQMATFLLKQLTASDPVRARPLALELERALEGHLILINLMAKSAPAQTQAVFTAATLAAQLNLDEVHKIEDQLETIFAPTPTSTPTSTATATPAPSATPSPTGTETPTGIPTSTPTPEGTPSPTLTPTPTQTGSASPAGTRTPAQASPTRTSTPRPGSTPTPTPSPRPTGTPTHTPRPSSTPSPTSTPRPTHTQTPRPTNTPTRRPTNTPLPTSPEPPPPSPYPPPAYPPPGY